MGWMMLWRKHRLCHGRYRTLLPKLALQKPRLWHTFSYWEYQMCKMAMNAVSRTSQNLSISCRQVTTCRSRWMHIHFIISINIAPKDTDWTYIPDFKTFRQSSREVSTSRQTLYDLYLVSLSNAHRESYDLHFSSFQNKNQNLFSSFIELNWSRYGNLLLWIAPNWPQLHHCSCNLSVSDTHSGKLWLTIPSDIIYGNTTVVACYCKQRFLGIERYWLDWIACFKYAVACQFNHWCLLTVSIKTIQSL